MLYWAKLSVDPKAEQCGWLKDKYGLSWQVSPTVMEEMMTKGASTAAGLPVTAWQKDV